MAILNLGYIQIFLLSFYLFLILLYLYETLNLSSWVPNNHPKFFTPGEVTPNGHFKSWVTWNVVNLSELLSYWGGGGGFVIRERESRLLLTQVA